MRKKQSFHGYQYQFVNERNFTESSNALSGIKKDHTKLENENQHKLPYIDRLNLASWPLQKM